MPVPHFTGWSSDKKTPRPDKVPPELAKYFRYVDGQFEWDGHALLTARGDKLEEVRDRLSSEYNINLLFDADSIYKILDRIYDLEKRVKDLEQEQEQQQNR
jgi:hypothetical protein